MGKIFYMMGKSSSGKDTIFQMISQQMQDSLQTVVPYTTRPMREGEHQGVQYYFCEEEELRKLMEAGKVIELREYRTVHGTWKYFTVDDDQINLDEWDYLMIGTLESYRKLRDYFGEEKVVPIYLEVEDGERLKRAIEREEKQDRPQYEELCRRFLADAKDFSEEKLEETGIRKRFCNCDLDEAVNEIRTYILGLMDR